MAGLHQSVTVSTPHRIVLVSGPPAAGKTALAQPLAQALGFALLTKDDVKESLYASLDGGPGDIEFSHRLSNASMDLLWTLAPHCPHVVLEANFRTRNPRERERFAALLAVPGARCVEVHCRIPLEEAARRFARRARNGRHPAHALQEMSLQQLADYAEPFGMSPTIEVDTTQPVDFETLRGQIVQILGPELRVR